MDINILISTIERFYEGYALLLVFLSGLIEMSPFGWIIPGGLIVAVAGYFAFGDPFSLLQILLLAWTGSWLSFLAAYLLGNKTGMKLVKKYKKEKSAQRAKTMLKNHGGAILTTSMLAGLTRFWIAYVAGSQNYSKLKFIFYSGAASLTWTSLQVVVGYLAGSEREHLESGIASLGIVAWIFLLAALAILYWTGKKEYKEFVEEEPKK